MKLDKAYIVLLIFTFCCYKKTHAQQDKQMVRIAKLVIDTNQLESYKAALTKEIKTSTRLEPRVLTLYAVEEMIHPHVTR